ncbi:ROK family protein [Streptomyces sp. NPDC090106]|uniref:ROK family protein n=1 Tax=Streptomyces sp. NPDC090106 TaxID=3365946 RepID=UPI00381CB94F
MNVASSPPPGHVVAVDLGGTGIKAALVARDGSVLRTERRATRRERGPGAVVDTVADTAAALAAESRALTGVPPLAVGVAVPGLVDTVRGVARYSANLGWRDLPLRAVLARRLGLPVALGHDVRAGALAEGRLGAGRGRDEFLFVALGTGIAAAHVRDGSVRDGDGGGAGELGHLTIRRGGPRCGCGRRGCLETLASASGVARRYARATGAADTGTAAGAESRSPASAAAPAAPVTAEEVCARASAGEPVARRVWDGAVASLADGLAAYTVLCDPGTVVIGGGLARAGAALMDPLRSALAARLAFHRPPELLTARLGDQAGCRGAALLALDLAEDRRPREHAPTAERRARSA